MTGMLCVCTCVFVNLHDHGLLFVKSMQAGHKFIELIDVLRKHISTLGLLKGAIHQRDGYSTSKRL